MSFYFTQVQVFDYFLKKINRNTMGNQWKLKLFEQPLKKKALRIRVELFALLHVWQHNFLVSHSFFMVLDAQKSRDQPLSNGSKIINFQNGEVFLRTRWKKVLV